MTELISRDKCKNGEPHKYEKSFMREDGEEIEVRVCQKCGYWY